MPENWIIQKKRFKIRGRAMQQSKGGKVTYENWEIGLLFFDYWQKTGAERKCGGEDESLGFLCLTIPYVFIYVCFS